MEYSEYYVAKGDMATIKQIIEKEVTAAILDDDQDGLFTPFIVWGTNDDFEEKWNWLLDIFDAESAAWGFTLYNSGKEIFSATYGENTEWGIDLSDNGYKGDLNKAAEALGVKVNA